MLDLKKWMQKVTQWINAESQRKTTVELRTSYSINTNLSITSAAYPRAAFALPVFANGNYGKYQMNYAGIVQAGATTIKFSNFCDGSTGTYIYSGTIDIYLILIPA